LSSSLTRFLNRLVLAAAFRKAVFPRLIPEQTRSRAPLTVDDIFLARSFSLGAFSRQVLFARLTRLRPFSRALRISRLPRLRSDRNFLHPFPYAFLTRLLTDSVFLRNLSRKLWLCIWVDTQNDATRTTRKILTNFGMISSFPFWSDHFDRGPMEKEKKV